MVVVKPTRTTWRAILGDAIGPAHAVVDIEGASGEWRRLLLQNGYFLLDAASALRGPNHDAILARHLVSRVREPGRLLAEWIDLLAPGGRIVLLESASRRTFLRRPQLLYPPRRRADPRAPYRRGLTPAFASMLLETAGLFDVRCFALPVPPAANAHYLASARRR